LLTCKPSCGPTHKEQSRCLRARSIFGADGKVLGPGNRNLNSAGRVHAFVFGQRWLDIVDPYDCERSELLFFNRGGQRSDPRLAVPSDRAVGAV